MMDGSRDIQGYGGGGGSGSQQGSVESPDNLQSIAYARVLDLWGEGELQGFVHPTNVLQDLALNGTPVANADGSLNFKNVKFDSRSGSQSQSFMSGFPDVENETGVGVELKSSTPWTQTITNLQLTAVRVRLSMPSIQKSDTTTGDITGYTVQYAIDLKTDSGEYQQCIASSFTGKSTSKYERAHRIDLPAATTGWTVRVRRLTANANLATVADTTTVESYTEITDGKFRYPNSAYGGLIVDASQFSSIPTRAFYMYGRIVSVPSNYNPTTRVYTGAWDGTFKPAWTNNPAWIFYDLVTNPRFGLGEYCPASLVNKWALYTIAQYCDGMVSDGFGGTEPRMTCNVFLQTQAEAYKVMQDLASVFRGIIYWAGGAIQAVADMPGDPVYTYTAANVVDGEFTYQGSGRKTRYTVALVSWNDQTDFGRAKVEYVSDDEGIARYGVQPIDATAFGCASRAQAHRVGLWTLYTSRLETGTVALKVGLDGTLCAPGQIIRVSDPARAGKRQAGRIHSATATAITVDNPPTVAVGDAITCALPTGITETHAVTAVSGNVISIASPGFSIAPQAESVWVVESSTLVAETYRVVSVLDDSSGDDIRYTITALQHNASKFDAIDFGDALMVPPVSVIPPSSQVGPASVTLSSNETAGTVLASILLSISWPATANAVRYQCEWRKDNGEWQTLGDHLKGLSADIHNAKPGTYYARVRAFNANGIGSVPTLSDPLVIADQSKQPTKLTDLKTEVDDAAQQAQIANAELAQIADDSLLSPPEKPTVERDYGVITTEQAGIDAQATAYGVTTEKTAYDNAVSALTSYLSTLTAPVAWNDKSGYTDIDGTTFKTKFETVYTARQTLLNAIYATAKKSIDSNAPLIINPYFTTGDLTGWTSDHGTVVFESGSNGPASASTTYARRNGSAGTPNEALRNTAKIPVYAGAVVKAQCAIRGINTPNGTAGVRISWRNASDTEISTTPGNTTTGNATNGTYVTGTAPAGAFFAHVECSFANHTTGSYTVDNFWASALADSMDQVPDGATRFGAVEAGADKTSGKPLSSLSGRTADYIGETATKKWAGETGATVGANWGTNLAARPAELTDGRIPAGMDNTGALVNGVTPLSRLGTRTLDYIGDSATRFAAAEAGADKTAGKSLDVLTDGATYARPLGSQLQNGVLRALSSGRNLISNGGFESNASGSTCGDGWDGGGGLFDAVRANAGSGVAHSGAYTLQINAAPGTVIPTGQSFVATDNFGIDCNAGDTLYMGAWFKNLGSPAAFPAGITGNLAAQIVFQDASNNLISSLSVSANLTASGWQQVTNTGVVPAGTVSAYAQVLAFTTNTTGSAWTVPANTYPFLAYVDDLFCYALTNLDTDAQDGATYGRTANADLYVSGGVNRVGLRVAGSGQTIGDQRNLQPITWASQRSVLSTSPISYSISGTTVSFSVSAFTLMGGGISINYGASSGSVTQSAGTTTTWFLYYRDAAQAGGSLPLNITTNPGGAASWPDSIFLGTAQVTVNSGGGGTGGTGGGGGGYCVADDMFIGEGRKAGDAEIGDPFDCLDLPTAAGKHVRALQGVSRGIEECVRMITSDGCALVCSISTPFDLPDGRNTTAPHMLGEQVITDLGVATVISLALVGPRPVTRAHLGGVSYAAGADPHRRIYSHNAGSINKP